MQNATAVEVETLPSQTEADEQRATQILKCRKKHSGIGNMLSCSNKGKKLVPGQCPWCHVKNVIGTGHDHFGRNMTEIECHIVNGFVVKGVMARSPLRFV